MTEPDAAAKEFLFARGRVFGRNCPVVAGFVSSGAAERDGEERRDRDEAKTRADGACHFGFSLPFDRPPWRRGLFSIGSQQSAATCMPAQRAETRCVESARSAWRAPGEVEFEPPRRGDAEIGEDFWGGGRSEASRSKAFRLHEWNGSACRGFGEHNRSPQNPKSLLAALAPWRFAPSHRRARF